MATALLANPAVQQGISENAKKIGVASLGEELRTPSVLAIFGVIGVFMLVFIFVLAAYWFELEKSKKLHPNDIGYGHWYFSLVPRIWISVVCVGWLLILTGIMALVFFVPGSILAINYDERRQAAKEKEAFRNIVNTDLAIIKSRGASNNSNSREMKVMSR